MLSLHLPAPIALRGVWSMCFVGSLGTRFGKRALLAGG